MNFLSIHRICLLGLLMLLVIGCDRTPKPRLPEPQPTPVVITTPPKPSPTPTQKAVPPKVKGPQVVRWETAEIRSLDLLRVDKAVALYQVNRPRYEAVTAMRKNGVPAPVVFGLHGRESTWSFSRHLHEGSPLTGRTKYVPKGRPLSPEPPYTWEQSAEDALYKLKDLENPRKVDWADMQSALQTIEAFNGLGYQKYHPEVRSPYLWAATTLYERGKYVADGKFDATAVDKQLGVAAVLKRMKERGIPITFDPIPL